MATPKSKFVQEGLNIDYTATAAAVSAGDIVEQSGQAGQIVSDLARYAVGSMRISGVVDVQKDASAITDGLMVGWDADGTTVNGATTGALTGTLASMDFVVGRALEAAGTDVADCKVSLNSIAPQALTNSTAGTAGTALATATGTDLAAVIIVQNNNMATLFGILERAGLIVT